MATKTTRTPRTGVYTWRKVEFDVRYVYAKNRSLRATAKHFGDPINHADIQRMLKGIEPKDARKRAALNLPAYAPAPVCHKCGAVHVAKRCTAKRQLPEPWEAAVQWLAEREATMHK